MRESFWLHIGVDPILMCCSRARTDLQPPIPDDLDRELRRGPDWHNLFEEIGEKGWFSMATSARKLRIGATSGAKLSNMAGGIVTAAGIATKPELMRDGAENCNR